LLFDDRFAIMKISMTGVSPHPKGRFSAMMTIGTCVTFDASPIADKFANLTKLGLHHCQLMSWDQSQRTDERAEEVIAACKEYDVTITALWCGWEGPVEWNFYGGQETLGLVPEPYRYARLLNLKQGADFAKKIGVSDIVTHMGYVPANPYDARYPGFVAAVLSLAAYLKQNDQYLLFETGQETPVTLLRLFEDVGLDNLGVNLDPANLILYGMGNPVDALDVFGKYVRGVHGKDGKYPTSGRELGEETPMGQGKVDFPALIKGLHELGYDGCITIEREIEGDQQTADIIIARDMLQGIIDNL